MSTASFKNAIAPFVARDIRPRWLIPIVPYGAQVSKNAAIKEQAFGKSPGRFSHKTKTWMGLSGDFVTQGVTEADYNEFIDWPTENAGVLGRAYPAIDCDVRHVEARVLVKRAMYEAFGDDAVFAERVRGKSPRRLYAFKCAAPNSESSWVRTRKISFTLPGEDEPHGVDIIGYGNQYVICGTHPSGDKYGWVEGEELRDDITRIDNADMLRFIEALTDIVEDAGGTLRTRNSKAAGENQPVDELEPVMSLEAVLEGLDKLPNTPENFPEREDLLSILAAIRAALGRDSDSPEVQEAIEAWATADDEWCPTDYFEKMWNSLGEVKIAQDSLDLIFRRHGVKGHAKHVFTKPTEAETRGIKTEKKKKLDAREELLATVASRYLFRRMNIRNGDSVYGMRDRWDVEFEWDGQKWWKWELAESDPKLLTELQAFEQYPVNKTGFANFVRDMRTHHPDIFFAGETMHPALERGDVFLEPQPDGTVRRMVNMRFQSQTMREARKPDPDPARSQRDVAHLLDFMRRMFGKHVDYELDTMAYQVQSGDRPGAMLFLVGDSGVGKSVYSTLQATLFDGTGPGQTGVVDGARLLNESARRFALAGVEGCRILSIRELPKDTNRPHDMAAITSFLKQVVDPGTEGDWISVEKKGKDIRPVRNFARVIISSNYANSLHVEAQDRRIFYIQAGITRENKPDESYYAEIAAITQDPARLAAFWRYLERRDIGGFSRHTPPPTSEAKALRVLAEMDAPERHLNAALVLLQSSNRTLFTAAELAELMTDMGENEYANSGGEIDDRIDYTPKNGRAAVEYMRAVRNIPKSAALKLEKQFRTMHERSSAIYVFPQYIDVYERLMATGKREADAIITEEQKNTPLGTHPFDLFAYPDRDEG